MKTVVAFLSSLLLALSLSAQLQQSIMFEKTWGGLQAERTILYADELPNGNFNLIGWRLYNFSNLAERPRFYMCQLDQAGNLVWEKYLGDGALGYNPGSIIKTQQGNYLIIGTSSLVAGSGDICLFHVDQEGNVLFEKYYTAGAHDGGRTVCETSDSCFMLAVGLNNGNNSSPGLIKVDRNGNEIWRNKQDSLPNLWHYFIRPLPSGEFLVTGVSPASRCYVSKYDANGALEWIKYPFGVDSLASDPRGLFSKSNGAFSIPIVRDDRTYWRQFDSAGNFMSERVYNCALTFSWSTWTNYPSFDYSDSSYVATIHRWNQNAADVFKIDKNQEVHFQTRVTVDSANKYLYYAIPTNDGGYLAVGSRRVDPDSASASYAVKFGSDGRYEPKSFSSTVTAYPNPSFNGNVTLSFDMLTNETIHVRILALDGRLVYMDELFCPANSQTELPVTLNEGTTAGGIYILEATTSTATYVQKLVVTRQH